MTTNDERMRNAYEERVCQICNGPFFVPKEGRSCRGRPSLVRSRRCYTCSPRCALKKRDDYFKLETVEKKEIRLLKARICQKKLRDKRKKENRLNNNL